jgi:HAD superfamily hydrolase (TIGR01509 family)
VVEAAARSGKSFALEALDEQLKLEEQRQFDTSQINWKPGLRELLEHLRSIDFPRAVASSTRRLRLDKIVGRTGLQDYFPVTVAGDEVEKGKPSPDIFLRAAEKLGADPRNCIVLEDAQTGVDAARAAEMKAIWIPDASTPPDDVSGWNESYKSLAEFFEIWRVNLSC